jgi:heat shock protein HtpX
MTPPGAIPHRIRNGAQALLLLGGMGALVAWVGWFVAGTAGTAGFLVIGLSFLLVSPRLSPRLILRLYGARQLTPWEAPGLFELLETLSRRAELPAAPRLYYIPSAILNAFSVGRGAEAAIAVTDGLLRGMPRRELAGVLAHELAHVRHNDIWIMGLADSVSRLVWLGSLFGQALLLVNLPMLLLDREALPWWPILLLLAAPTIGALLQLGLSRNREFEADLTAASLTGDPRGLALALDKLEQARQGLFERILLPGRREAQPSLLRTHPATEERIERLLALERAEEREIPEPVVEIPVTFIPEDWPAVTRRPARRWHGVWY